MNHRRRGASLFIAGSLLAGAGACSRPGAPVALLDATSPDAAPAPEALNATPPSATPPARPAPAPDDRSLLPRTEARRTRLVRPTDDPAIAPSLEAIRAQLGAAPFPLDLQSTALGTSEAGDRDRRALLLGGRDAERWLVLVADATGHAVWSKDHPTAGILPRVSELAIAPAPHGGVALFFFDPPARVLGARRWDSEGGLLVDFQLLELATCDALSALYWPGHGWIVAAARAGETRAQLLGESGGMAWGHEGIAIAGMGPAPVSIALDTDATFVAVQRGPSSGVAKGKGDRLLAYRYDARGTALWDAPVDVGALPATIARVALERVAEGTLRVRLSSPVTITSDGTVRGSAPR